VVSTRVSGIPLAVTSGSEGLLVEEQDVEALGHALADLLADPTRRRAFGSAARRRVLAELTWDRVAVRHHQAYLAALGEGASADRG
jgi:glycosyltransferase involved in cell wall biosynthesis